MMQNKCLLKPVLTLALMLFFIGQLAYAEHSLNHNDQELCHYCVSVAKPIANTLVQFDVIPQPVVTVSQKAYHAQLQAWYSSSPQRAPPQF